MGIDIGFGELLDRVEGHIGKWPTKILIYAAWLAALAFCISTFFELLIKPLISTPADVRNALGLLGILQLVFTVIIGLGMASWILDAYRVKVLRTELEDSTGEARELLDEMIGSRRLSKLETREVIDESNILIAQVKSLRLRADDINQTSLMIAEQLYEKAVEREPLPPEDIVSLGELIEDLRRITKIED